MSEITREQIEKIKTEASHSDVQEGLVSMIPNEVVSLCDLAIKGLEADERARQAVQAALEGAATIADAWVTPEQRLYGNGGPAALIRALIKKEPKP